MKGLILKDLYLIKGNGKSLIIFLIVFLPFSFQNPDSITAVLPIICSMLSITTFSYDDYNKWHPFSLTLPVSRQKIVASKYILAILLALSSSIISIILVLLINIKVDINIETAIYTSLGAIVGVSLLISVMYPLIYKFGSEKGRLFLIFIVLIFSALIRVVMKYVNEEFLTKIIKIGSNYIIYIIPIIIIIILYLSYKISVKIYSKKEY